MFEYLSPAGTVAAALIAPPGADVIAALAATPADTLSESAAADLLAAWERQSAWLASHTSHATARVARLVRRLEESRPDAEPELVERSVRCEVAAATRLSEVTADHRIMVSGHLAGRLAVVDEALRLGDITFWQACAICEMTDPLTDAQAVLVARRVLPRARSQTVAQLRACLRRALLSVVPERARAKAREARARHDVDVFPLPDGQAELRVTADAADVLAVYKVIQEAARKLGALEQTSGDRRSAGQLRVAALLQLVTGTSAELPGRPYRVTVEVTMDLPTLLGLREHPAELAGYGALPPSLGRELAADGSWRRLLHDPTSGALLDLGRRRYRPSAALADFVRTRDVTCIFPGCRRRAQACDLDHAVPHRHDGSGGATDRHNLHPLCPKHHRVKHETSWTLRTSETERPYWVSPLGQRYPVGEVDHRPAEDDDFLVPDEPEMPQFPMAEARTVSPNEASPNEAPCDEPPF